MHLKLDELIRASKPARDSFVDLEDLTDEELGSLDEEFKKLHDQQAAAPAIHKLHTKISEEHKRRQTVKQGITNLADHAKNIFTNKNQS